MTRGAGVWHEKGSILFLLAPDVCPTCKLCDLGESLLVSVMRVYLLSLSAVVQSEDLDCSGRLLTT